MKRSFENTVTMPNGVTYECEISKGYFSNIGNEHQKSLWLTRKISKYNIERISIHLGSRHLFISVYINGESAVSIVEPTDDQILALAGTQLSIEETFEYCRKTFCPDLSAISTKPKNKPAITAQPDLFEMV